MNLAAVILTLLLVIVIGHAIEEFMRRRDRTSRSRRAQVERGLRMIRRRDWPRNKHPEKLEHFE